MLRARVRTHVRAVARGRRPDASSLSASPRPCAQGYGIHHSKVGLAAAAARGGRKNLEMTGDGGDEGDEVDERAPFGGGGGVR